MVHNAHLSQSGQFPRNQNQEMHSCTALFLCLLQTKVSIQPSFNVIAVFENQFRFFFPKGSFTWTKTTFSAHLFFKFLKLDLHLTPYTNTHTLNVKTQPHTRLLGGSLAQKRLHKQADTVCVERVSEKQNLMKLSTQNF